MRTGLLTLIQRFPPLLLSFLGSNPISWSAHKQRVVSRSSTEVEFRALAAATSETVWLHSLITKLGLHLKILLRFFAITLVQLISA